MKIKYIWLIFCILGLILPYSAYMPYFMEYGFNLTDFIKQAFADPISAFLSWDLVVAVFTMFIFIIVEGRKLNIKYFWLPIACMIFIGAAFGFPLFLYMRQVEMEKTKKT